MITENSNHNIKTNLKPVETNTSSALISAQLAPPGAGIPLHHMLLLKLIVKPFIAGRTSWEESEKNFVKINNKILKELEFLNEDELCRQVLIPPMKGIEDSSRFWSIKMVLEHLNIVSHQMFQLIPILCNENLPNAKADIAAVKPKNKVSLQNVLEDFNKLITDDFHLLNQKIINKNSKIVFYHPWFGNMSAKEWYWLLAAHHGTHLRQIRSIKKRLPLL